MNMSLESYRSELTEEERITASGCRPTNPQLAADWDLRQALRDIQAPPLPPRLRTRVLQTTRRPGPSAWWTGLAAAVVLGLGTMVILQSPESTIEPHRVSEADLQNLQLALSTLEYTARRTRAITGRELAASLALPDLNLNDLLHVPQLRQWMQAPITPNDHSTKE
jgi:hypothetical protein